MKTTTFAPMKVGKNQTILPSGVKASNDGKYHYWQCSVSGLETFAKPEYWVKIMAKYGTEENLVKTYVCQKAQKMLAEGMTQAEIIAQLASGKTYVAKKAKKEVKAIKAERKELTKKKRSKGLKSFAVGTVEMAVQEDTGSIKVEKVPVYPWQGDPNYFGGGVNSPLSIAEATRESCAFPAKNLDDECRGCPFHADCKCSARFSEEDWKKPRSKNTVKVTQIKSFE
jgi:hypothetical protein